MTRSVKIGLFYTGVAVISVAIIALSLSIRRSMLARQPQPEKFMNVGKEQVQTLFPITKDLDAVNQEGAKVKLSDLRGKVWLVAEFFATCPHCAVRNGSELRAIYDEFRNHPDFQVVCISVEPETDNAEKLRDYAKALGAETKNWWFLNGGDTKAVHKYLEEDLKFFGIRERRDPLEIEANGRYEHDMGFLLVDRDFNVVKKWPLVDARSDEAKKIDPGLYDRLKKDLYEHIRSELQKNKTSGL